MTDEREKSRLVVVVEGDGGLDNDPPTDCNGPGTSETNRGISYEYFSFIPQLHD